MKRVIWVYILVYIVDFNLAFDAEYCERNLVFILISLPVTLHYCAYLEGYLIYAIYIASSLGKFFFFLVIFFQQDDLPDVGIKRRDEITALMHFDIFWVLSTLTQTHLHVLLRKKNVEFIISRRKFHPNVMWKLFEDS